MALRASWIATWVMAYRRASAGDGPTGEMQAATAALPAFSFQTETASRWCALAGTASAATEVAATRAASNGRWSLTFMTASFRGGRGRAATLPEPGRWPVDFRFTRPWAGSRVGRRGASAAPRAGRGTPRRPPHRPGRPQAAGRACDARAGGGKDRVVRPARRGPVG